MWKLEEYMFYYNNKRIKSKLKGKGPVQFRTLAQSAVKLNYLSNFLGSLHNSERFFVIIIIFNLYLMLFDNRISKL